MEGLNEGVVQEEHNRGKIPSNLRIPEKHLADITDIANLGVPKTKFPDDQRGIKNKAGLSHRQDEAWHQTKDRV